MSESRFQEAGHQDLRRRRVWGRWCLGNSGRESLEVSRVSRKKQTSLRPGWIILRPRDPDLTEFPCLLLKPSYSFFFLLISIF